MAHPHGGPHYLIRNNYSWCFRLRVPLDLQLAIGKKEIRRSLKTGRIGLAKSKARLLAGEYQELFRKMRGHEEMTEVGFGLYTDSMTDEEIQCAAKKMMLRFLDTAEEDKVNAEKPLSPAELEKKKIRLAEQRDRAKDQLARCDYHSISVLIGWFSKVKSIFTIPPIEGSPTYRKLQRELLKQLVIFFECEIDRANGDYSRGNEDYFFGTEPGSVEFFRKLQRLQFQETQVYQIPEAKTEPKDQGPFLDEVIEEYLSDCTRRNSAPRAITEYQSVLKNVSRLLSLITNSTPLSIHLLNKKICIELRETLLKLPKDYFQDAMRKKPKYAGIGLSEIVQGKYKETISIGNTNKYISFLSTLLNFCVSMDHIKENPAVRLTINVKKPPASTVRDIFSPEDLFALFNSKEYTKDKHIKASNFWVPILALYTGARLEELCQLLVEDLKKTDDEIWFLDITASEDDDGKRIKTASGYRSIPLHPFIVDELNFPGFVEKIRSEGHERIWHELSYVSDRWGHSIGKWFKRYKERYGISDRKKSFHSFRHTFSDNLKQQLISGELIDELTGHVLQGESLSRYGKPYGIPALYNEGILKLKYDLDLSHLRNSRWVVPK